MATLTLRSCARQNVVEAARVLEHTQAVAAEVFACPWTSPEHREVQANLVRLAQAVFDCSVAEYLRRLN